MRFLVIATQLQLLGSKNMRECIYSAIGLNNQKIHQLNNLLMGCRKEVERPEVHPRHNSMTLMLQLQQEMHIFHVFSATPQTF